MSYEGGARAGLKLLLVGDSHYDAEATADLTSKVVEEWAIAHPIGFFEHLRNVGLGRSPALDPSEFWRRVAFCNLVQDCMSASSDTPSDEQISRGWLALRETVAELDPHLILVFSRRVWDSDVTSSATLDLSGMGSNRLARGFRYGVNIYETPGKSPIVAAVANHPSRLNVFLDVWRSWIESVWEVATEVASG